MASPNVQPPVAKSKALYCPNCGGPIELRGFGYALTAVCPQCLSVLDASTPELKIIQQMNEKLRIDPKIPLGSRGKLNGVDWEVIGFQRRDTSDDEDTYSWDEYLLFNPYKGFRYLTEYDGHWNFVTPMESVPIRIAMGSKPAVVYQGRRFKHFDGAPAQTSFVLGEFPWRVQVGETVIADDWVDPPTVLSSETTDYEVTWSRGEYTDAAVIWKAFELKTQAPAAQGVYLNQPSPYKNKGSPWKHFFWFLMALVVMACVFADISKNDVVFQHSYRFATNQGGEPSFVTPIFELKGRPSGLEMEIATNLSNNWAYFNLTLINQDNGQGFDFGREVSYYSGSDSDGSWTEGSSNSSVYIPAVPAGHYYLRVEPEMDTPSARRSSDESVHTIRPVGGKPFSWMDYTITLKHDVPNYNWFWIAALLLLIPPIFHSIRRRSFEAKRAETSGGRPPSTPGSGIAGSIIGGIIESIGE